MFTVPNDTDHLALWIKHVAGAAPKTPAVYYHIPVCTKVTCEPRRWDYGRYLNDVHLRTPLPPCLLFGLIYNTRFPKIPKILRTSFMDGPLWESEGVSTISMKT